MSIFFFVYLHSSFNLFSFFVVVVVQQININNWSVCKTDMCMCASDFYYYFSQVNRKHLLLLYPLAVPISKAIVAVAISNKARRWRVFFFRALSLLRMKIIIINEREKLFASISTHIT